MGDINMAKSTEQKAIEIVMEYEKREGRNPRIVSREGVGHDIESNDRMIEVKGVGESWRTYNWQSLYKNEVECLNNDPKDFYLYIIKFKDTNSDEVVGFYIVPGIDLKAKFRIEIETYSLRPISETNLKEFLRDWKSKPERSWREN